MLLNCPKILIENLCFFYKKSIRNTKVDGVLLQIQKAKLRYVFLPRLLQPKTTDIYILKLHWPTEIFRGFVDVYEGARVDSVMRISEIPQPSSFAYASILPKTLRQIASIFYRAFLPNYQKLILLIIGFTSLLSYIFPMLLNRFNCLY